jgi:fructokinase
VRLLSIGEILWDVFGKSEILGGAPLNFSVAAQKLGHQVALVTAVGDDRRGRRALDSMRAFGLSADFVQVLAGKNTGTAQVTMDDAGNASYFIERPAAFDPIQLDNARLSAIQALRPAWLYFGTLAQTNPASEEMLHRILGRLPGVQCFYDMNLREGHWNLPLVERLSGLASIVKLNETEAETLFRLTHAGEAFSLEQFCRSWSSTYGVENLCVTLGSEGCAIFMDNRLVRFAGRWPALHRSPMDWGRWSQAAPAPLPPGPWTSAANWSAAGKNLRAHEGCARGWTYFQRFLGKFLQAVSSPASASVGRRIQGLKPRFYCSFRHD